MELSHVNTNTDSHRPQSPTVSVVIPTLNEERNLPHVFAKLPSLITEVIVVSAATAGPLATTDAPTTASAATKAKRMRWMGVRVCVFSFISRGSETVLCKPVARTAPSGLRMRAEHSPSMHPVDGCCPPTIRRRSPKAP